MPRTSVVPHLNALLLVSLAACGGRDEAAEPDTTAAAEDAEWIVFASMRSGDGDVYGVDPTDGTVRRLTGTDAPEGTVRYDPARNRIVYHRFDDEAAMLVADGVDLFVDPNGDVAPVWSPDGSVAYVLEAEGAGDIWLTGPDGTDPVRLTDDPAVERYPAWSPDGERLVYARRLASGWDLFQMTVADRTETRITELERYVGHPSWSPDGRRIAFDTFRGEQTEIAVLELATGAVELVTDRPGNDMIPAWSADGTRLAFGAEVDGNWDIWLLTLATGELERLTTDPMSDGGPVFVPASALPTR